MTLQVSVNAKPPKILPDMLVQDIFGTVGLVTKVTRNWVHVTVLIRGIPDHFYGLDINYHVQDLYTRKELTPLPAGYKLEIKQKDSGSD